MRIVHKLGVVSLAGILSCCGGCAQDDSGTIDLIAAEKAKASKQDTPTKSPAPGKMQSIGDSLNPTGQAAAGR